MTSLRIKPVAEWPEGDRALWVAANRDGTPFDGGPAANLSAKSKRQMVKVYGQFLTWYDAEVGDLASVSPLQRITEANLRAFFEYLKGCRSQQSGKPLSPVTIASRIGHVYWIVTKMYPDADLAWLKDVRARLGVWAKPVRNKSQRIEPIEDLVEAGLRFMTQAEVDPERDRVQRATGYRDGLIVALLAVTGRRLANLAAIRLGQHLKRRGDRYWLSFEAHEMKHQGGGAERNIPIPVSLTPFVDQYLETHRVVLLRGKASDQMWVSLRGRALTDHAVYYAVRRVTESMLGTRLNPHLFRDCIATSMAVEDSVLAGMIARILSHSSPLTTKRFYDHSRSLEASRTLARHVATQRALPAVKA